MDYNYCYQFRIGDDRMIHCCPIFWARLEAFGHFVIDDAASAGENGYLKSSELCQDLFDPKKWALWATWSPNRQPKKEQKSSKNQVQ
jgi:hypothetical protein